MLLVVFLLLAFVLTLFLWGGAMLLQGWLYQDPAERMPLRAAVSGTIMAGFLTFWCLLNAHSGGKYDTLFEFTPMELVDHDAFDSVMKKANGDETIVHYTKRSGGTGVTTDFVDGKGQSWKKNTADSMAVAILIQDKDKSEPVRFNANLEHKKEADGVTRPVFPSQLTELRYTDAAGRYMSPDSLGRVYRKKSGLLYANLLLNTFHFLLWWMVLWYGLRFSLWHACGLAFAMWLFVMLAAQPVLFSQTRPKAEEKTAQA